MHTYVICICVAGCEKPECGQQGFQLLPLPFWHSKTIWAILHVHQTESICDVLTRNGNRLPLGTAVKLWQAGNCPPCASVRLFQSIVVYHKLKGIYLFSKIKTMGVQSSRTVIDNGNVESGEIWFSAGCGCWHRHYVLCNISLCWH